MGLSVLARGFDVFSESVEKSNPGKYTESIKREKFDALTSFDGADEPFLEANSDYHAAHISGIMEKGLPYLLGRPWTLIRFEHRALITSDEPFGYMRPQDLDPNLGVGLETAEALIFPLTRKLGLMMRDPRVFIRKGVQFEEVEEGKCDYALRGTTTFERLFNYITVESAHRQIFFHPEDLKYVPQEIRSTEIEGTPQQKGQ